MEPENPQHEQYIANLVISLIQELESKAASLNTDDMFLTKLKLMEAAKNFRVSRQGCCILSSNMKRDNANVLFVFFTAKIHPQSVDVV